jgi:hypothetical protein
MRTNPAFAALLLMGCAATVFAADDSWYDFRSTPQYAALSPDDCEKLEQVHHDFALLWGALDMYADAHGGKPPYSLDALVPRYLSQLPSDPFATDTSAAKDVPKGYKASLDGRGYRYCGAPIRAWIVSSVGLPRFPYLAKRGNYGLYRCKGDWAGGELDVRFETKGPNHAILQYLERRGR